MFSKTVTQLSNLFKKNFEERNLSAVLAVQVDCISKWHGTKEYGEIILDILEDLRRLHELVDQIYLKKALLAQLC